MSVWRVTILPLRPLVNCGLRDLGNREDKAAKRVAFDEAKSRVRLSLLKSFDGRRLTKAKKHLCRTYLLFAKAVRRGYGAQCFRVGGAELFDLRLVREILSKGVESWMANLGIVAMRKSCRWVRDC